ncbi:MAG TPA: DUF4340 domain-containing protein [Candidatus Binataceae bacterium]|nr:DUF4340 domain-containing protein [Candidatus Binataceae bacterium]
MKLRNTIIALVLLAIVGGYALVMYRYQVPVGGGTVLDVKSDEIKSVELKTTDLDLMIERDKGGTWKIVKPMAADADKFGCINLAQAIADAKVESTVDENPSDLEQFGLKNPATTVYVTTFDGKPHPGIEVGKTTPVGFHAYVKTTDKPAVMLTASSFPSGMSKKFNDLRSRELMSFQTSGAKVNKLILTHADGKTLEFDRQGDHYQMVKPFNFPTDSTRVTETISTLGNANADSFVSDAPTNVAQYGLDKPQMTAAVILDNGQQQSLLFGSKSSSGSGVYVRRGESVPVYTVGDFELNNLDVPLMEFHDKTVFDFDPAKVDGFDITNSTGTFSLRKTSAGKWDVVQGGHRQNADVTSVMRLMDRVQGLKGMGVLADPMTPADYGLEHPNVTITVLGANDKPIGTVWASKRDLTPEEGYTKAGERTAYYVTSSAGTAAFQIPGVSFLPLDKPPTNYILATPTPTSASTPIASAAPSPAK